MCSRGSRSRRCGGGKLPGVSRKATGARLTDVLRRKATNMVKKLFTLIFPSTERFRLVFFSGLGTWCLVVFVTCTGLVCPPVGELCLPWRELGRSFCRSLYTHDTGEAVNQCTAHGVLCLSILEHAWCTYWTMLCFVLYQMQELVVKTHEADLGGAIGDRKLGWEPKNQLAPNSAWCV